MSKVVKSVYTMVSDQRNIMTIPVLRVIPPVQPNAKASVPASPESASEEIVTAVESSEEILQQARMEAEAILETARIEAEAVKIEAGRQAEELLRQAEVQATDVLSAANQTGYQAGYEAGKAAAEADYQNLLEQAMALLQTVEDEKNQYYQQAQRDLIELACAISSKIMNRHLETEGSWILSTVQDALEEIVDPTKIEIYAHPHDISLLAERRAELLPRQSIRADLQFKADATIERGGCILRTKQGSVDARIDTQVIEVKRALLEIAANL